MQKKVSSPIVCLILGVGMPFVGMACGGSGPVGNDEAPSEGVTEPTGPSSVGATGGVAGAPNAGTGPTAGDGVQTGRSDTGGAGAAGNAGPASAGVEAAAGSGGVQAAGAGDVPSGGAQAGRAGQDAMAGAGAGMGGDPDAASAGTSADGGDGFISIDDPVPGFAGVAGNTTGGGADLSRAVSVSSMGELRSATSGSAPALVLVQPGNYAGELAPGANKTIVGVSPGVKITGNIKISGADRSNIIIRNLAVQGEKCASYDACKSGADAVYVGNGAHHVWLDHLDIADGQDGNCDVTQGGDYVTVSWTHFHYTYNKEHRFSNLIAGSDDEPASVGKLHITYMTSHWGERIDQRQPRGRFGDIHMLNNYHSTGGSQIHGVGKDMALIAENCVYEERISIWTDMGSPRGWKGIGNLGTASNLNDSRGVVFEIPYDYAAMPAADVVSALSSPNCGAGNTCELAR